MKNTISNSGLRELVKEDVVVCSVDRASIDIDNSEENGIILEVSLDTDNEFHVNFWTNEGDEGILTDSQQDYIYEVLETSLTNERTYVSQSQQDDIYDLQFDAMSTNGLIF